MTNRPRIIVVYDLSAAAPVEIVAGLRPLAEVTFAVHPSSFSLPLLPHLRELADVVMLGEPDSLARLRALAPDAVVTFSDRVVSTTAEIAEELGLPYHSVACAHLLTDKYLQRERLSEQGVGTARNALLRSPSDWPEALTRIGLPAVLKPVHGEGSRNTYKIEDTAEGAEAARLLVEELLGGARAAGEGPAEAALVLETFLTGVEQDPFADYVSVESVVSHGTVSHLAVTGKFRQPPPFREVGQFWPAPLDPGGKEAVLDLTTRAVTALGIRTGVLHTEVKLTAQGPEVIEVNGRLGGMIDQLCRTATGVDLIGIAGRLALGEHIVMPELALDGVTFQHCTLTPVEAFRLEKIHGAATVRRTPGITAYRPRIRAGRELEASVGTRYLDYLCGTAPDHEAMTKLLDTVLDELSFTFTLPTGPTTLTARELTAV
ncbi:ATP-grasp domain-containing protein [Streptomyces sp. NPDC046909]|uniref:ATP-grasp domain-containing protein n=1 Tax=Streptomyces sp. NPDC046909 TaxID=3155617 RepID=UPI0033CC3D50